VIKCGVCGSENEPEALFCVTCGSPLSPAEAKAIVDDATKVTETAASTGDDSVVPGKGGARRDLGTGGAGTTSQPKSGGAGAETVVDQETASGGPTIVCTVCGTVNDATRTYCRKCANELKQAAPPPPTPATPTAGRKFSPLALGLGAAAIVVAIILVAVLALGGKPASSLPPSAQASPGGTAGGVLPTPGDTAAPTPTQRAFSEGDPSGQIAFARCGEGGTACVIFMRPADKSENASRIIGVDGGSATDPALSHDGTQIMYSADGDDPGLQVVTISNKSVDQHSTGEGDTNVDWSSDDSQITFAGHRDRDPDPNGDLEVRLDGAVSGTSEPLTENDLVDHDPVFLPDDSAIIFVQGEGNSRELKRLDLASKEITDLTSDEFADEDPAVSPDGTEVVFASERAGAGEFDLFLMDLATQEITKLPTMAGDEHDPVWSPGGRYIAFAGGTAGAEDIFILDLADGSFSQFTTAAGAERTPSWQ
jgi:Tol biopolymer transport system component